MQVLVANANSTDTAEIERIQRMLDQCASLTQAVSRLPAVATPDWCDRAASALAGVHPHADVVVMVAQIDHEGRVRDVHSVGAAAIREGKLERDAAINLRVRAEGLRGLVWTPETRAGAIDRSVAGQAFSRADVMTSPHGSVWQLPATSSLLATASRIGGSNDRVVIAYLVLPEATQTVFESMLVVRLGTALLARMADMALGSGTVQWLTHREHEVLNLLVLGHSVKEISETLGRSPHTIHDHVKSLHKKLSATSRGELVARALGHIPPCSSH